MGRGRGCSAVYEGGLGTMTEGPHLQLVSLTAD